MVMTPSIAQTKRDAGKYYTKHGRYIAKKTIINIAEGSIYGYAGHGQLATLQKHLNLE